MVQARENDEKLVFQSFSERQAIRRRQIVGQARENDEKLFWRATAKPLPTEKGKAAAYGEREAAAYGEGGDCSLGEVLCISLFSVIRDCRNRFAYLVSSHKFCTFVFEWAGE